MSNNKEENQKLIKEYIDTKSKVCFDKLVLENQGLIIHVMKKINIPKNMREDYIDLGNILLVNAIKTYDASYLDECSFSTFAFSCIKNGFITNIRKENMHCVRGTVFLDMDGPSDDDTSFYETFVHPDLMVDVEEMEKFIDIDSNNYNKKVLMTVINSFSNQDKDLMLSVFNLDGRERLSQGELAEKYNVTRAEISRRLLKCLNILKKSLRIERVDGEKKLRIDDEIECRLLLENYGFDEEKKTKIIETIDCLKDRDKEIITKRFGLKDGVKVNEEKLAEEYDLTVCSIKLIIKNSIKKISDIVNRNVSNFKENTGGKINKKDCKKRK